MNYFLNDSSERTSAPPKIILPESTRQSIRSGKEKEMAGDDPHSDIKKENPTATSRTRCYNAPFTLQELQEAASCYLAQGMPPDTPVYVTTADCRIPPRSKTSMIGLYPGVMEEAGQMRIETRHPVVKRKGFLSKISDFFKYLF